MGPAAIANAFIAAHTMDPSSGKWFMCPHCQANHCVRQNVLVPMVPAYLACLPSVPLFGAWLSTVKADVLWLGSSALPIPFLQPEACALYLAPLTGHQKTGFLRQISVTIATAMLRCVCQCTASASRQRAVTLATISVHQQRKETMSPLATSCLQVLRPQPRQLLWPAESGAPGLLVRTALHLA